MNKISFCSIVSETHIYKAIVMANTLKKTCGSYDLYLLCMNPDVYKIFSRLKTSEVTLISLPKVETKYLTIVKQKRSFTEYCWTLKPFLVDYIIHNYKKTEYYAYIDADLWFLSDPTQIFLEAPKHSIYLTDHRNNERWSEDNNIYGRYNGGFVGFRNEAEAIKAINWWKVKCLESCTEKPDIEKGLFSDQRYLERFQDIFNKVHVVQNIGANVAHWNIGNYNFAKADGLIILNEKALIFYHFSGFYIYSKNEFNLCWRYRIPNDVVNLVYLPYMREVNEAVKLVGIHFQYFNKGFSKRNSCGDQHLYILKS